MITPEGLCAEHDEINSCDSCAENERERIIALLSNDEVMHDIWWLIKRQDEFPSQEFIAEVIGDRLALIKGEI